MARAEYGAEFRDDLADFVTREVVDQVTMWGRSELPPVPGITYSAFCDPSGGASDAMTLAIAHITGDGVVVLDAIAEARPPFDPEQVVRDFAALLRRYGVNSVVGDRYGGEWPRQRFREHGISYEPSARPKSDMYIDLLPLLNAGRVELLDVKRLSVQLVGLERRTARSGRDSVDHVPGGHDDLANAVAGVLVGLDLDRRPALIRQSEMLIGGKPVPLPRWGQCVFSTLVVGQDGVFATAYFSHHEIRDITDPAPLVLLDFDLAPLTGATVGGMFAKLEELHRAIPKVWAHFAYVPASYLQHVHLEGFDADCFPDDALDDLPGLAIGAAGHVNSARFKIAEAAAEKAQHLPLAGALGFRPGEAIDANPLRLAVLLGIELALSPQSSRSAPVMPTA